MTDKTKRTKSIKRKGRKPSRKKDLVYREPKIDLDGMSAYDFSYKQVVDAHAIYQTSRYAYSLCNVMGYLRGGLIPTKMEQEAIDEFITLYNTLCKSALAKAIKED